MAGLVVLLENSHQRKLNRHLVSVTRTVVQAKMDPEVKEDAYSGDKGTAAPIYSIDGKLYQYDVILQPKDSVSILWYRYEDDTTKVYELVKI